MKFKVKGDFSSWFGRPSDNSSLSVDKKFPRKFYPDLPDGLGPADMRIGSRLYIYEVYEWPLMPDLREPHMRAVILVQWGTNDCVLCHMSNPVNFQQNC